MSEPKRPSPEQLQQQIAAYLGELPHYETYAKSLRRVLEAACKPHLREAIVQARPKDVSSFAEKCVRKFEQYPDAVRQMTDLCGGRVIVQTQSQVGSVRRFVEQNFTVTETEDIGLRLGEKEFGYRDRHYIVQLKPERAAAVGFASDEIQAIGERKAELQIRTWAQHAWADTLHDRTYKSPLKLTTEASRTAALLAALMEDGDRNFDRLANELDGMVANYAAYADRARVEAEIDFQQFLLDHETEAAKRPALALRMAPLRAALGQHEKVIALIEPCANESSPFQDELRLELGTALCRQHRREPPSKPYQRGQGMIREVVGRLAEPQGAAVLNLRRRESLRARALSRLGWACEADESRTGEAGKSHRLAHELEPANPYYLANMLGFELRGGTKAEDLTGCLRPTMLQALLACESHAKQEIELPFAYFTAGRLRLLLGEHEAALQDYLRGAHHCMDGKGCYGCEVIDDEVAWLHRVKFKQDLPSHFQHAKDFLLLAKVAKGCADPGGKAQMELPAAHANITGPVLIIAGGAASIKQETLDRFREPLTGALRDFRGTVISGGTRSGVPGLVGEITQKLRAEGINHFRLLGYRPVQLPDDATKDENYEPIRIGESQFTAAQILANWTDILAAGIPPSEVRLLGIGGGPVASVEYRMALAMGASVGVMPVAKNFTEPLDAVDAILVDPQWKEFTNLLPLPFDAATLRAFLNEPGTTSGANKIENMAQELHRRYLATNQHKLQENLRPWPLLPATYKNANLAQAGYIVEILRAAGFSAREATGAPDAIKSFAGDEFKADVERMGELEHGRWNVERLREGWRPGKVRDNERKIQPCLVPWSNDDVLTKEIKDYDRSAVLSFPEILAIAKLEIHRQ